MTTFATRQEILHGLDLCDQACGSTAPANATWQVGLDAFELNGRWFAFVVNDGPEVTSRKRRAYVVFRGTEPTGWGTWLFTNAQAASVPFVVRKPILPASTAPVSAHPDQDPALPVVDGRIHQGFLRAWSWLWCGHDFFDAPIKTFVQTLRNNAVLYCALFIAATAGTAWLLVMYGWTLNSAAAAGFFVALGTLGAAWAVQSGRFESLFWRGARLNGQPLQERVRELNGFDEVWFVGHSLGGGLATVAFSAYREWCRVNALSRDNGRLLTFASPMVGDSIFVRAFEKQHKDRYLHVMDEGDPVTYLPPARLRVLLHRLPIPLSITGMLVLGLPIVWFVVALFWRQRFFDGWEQGVWRLGGRFSWISALKHTRSAYRKRISDWRPSP